VTAGSGKMLCRAHHCMIVSCRAHGCIFLSFLLKRQKITTVGSEQPENITFHGKRQKKSAMGRSVPKRWAQVDFTAGEACSFVDFRCKNFRTPARGCAGRQGRASGAGGGCGREGLLPQPPPGKPAGGCMGAGEWL